MSEFATLTAAAAHPPALILVEGEAGVGKTRLLAELAAAPELRRHRWLAGQCLSLREPSPLSPLIDALRTATTQLAVEDLGPLAGALRPLLPELADRLPPPFPVSGDPTMDRQRLFAAVRDLLDGLGRTVLVVEDLHWVDGGTYELLRYLAARLPRKTTLVLSYRRSDSPAERQVAELAGHLPPQGRAVEMSLEPLNQADVGVLAAALLGVPVVSSALAADLHDYTRGLPFVLEEVLRLVPDATAHVLDETIVRQLLNSLTVPIALRGSLIERTNRMSDEGKRIVAAAAVANAAASEDLLAGMTGMTPDVSAAAIDDALAHGLLRESEPGAYGFRHALAQRAMYESLPTDQRRRLHREAANVLEHNGDPPYAQLAHHCREGGRTQDWVRYAELAADRAAEVGDDDAATDLLSQVLSVSFLASEDRVRMAVKLGKAALCGMSHAGTATVLRRVIAEGHLPRERRGELRLHLGLLLVNQAGQIEAGRTELRTAAAELADRPTRAAWPMAALGIPVFGEEHLDDHERWLSAAAAAVAGSGDLAAQTLVRLNRVTLNLFAGEPGSLLAAHAALQHGSSMGELRQLARGASNMADAAVWLGHDIDAGIFLDRGVRLATEHEHPFARTIAAGTKLRLDFAAGRWDAISDDAARTLADAQDMPMVRAEALLVLGLLKTAKGHLTAALHQLQLAAETAGPDGSLPILTAVTSALARIRVTRGETEIVVTETARCVELLRRKGIWAWAAEIVPFRCIALHKVGRGVAAAALLEEFTEGITGRDAPAAEAAAILTRGHLAELGGNAHQAVDLFDQAADRYQKIGRPYDATRAREDAARCRLDTGDTHSLIDVAATFDAMSARWDGGRCRGLLREVGVVVPHRRGRRGYGNELSPREQQVVKLAAEGRTNLEIAEALFISVRTAEHHIGSALRKLGVASRHELTDDDIIVEPIEEPAVTT